MIGHQFILAADTSAEQPAIYQYSGINWRLVSEQPIASGTKVEVIAVDVGQITIKPCA